MTFPCQSPGANGEWRWHWSSDQRCPSQWIALAVRPAGTAEPAPSVRTIPVWQGETHKYILVPSLSAAKWDKIHISVCIVPWITRVFLFLIAFPLQLLVNGKQWYDFPSSLTYCVRVFVGSGYYTGDLWIGLFGLYGIWESRKHI